MAAPTVEELNAAVGRLTGDLKKSRESSEGITSGFTKLLNVLLPIGIHFKAFQFLSGKMGEGLKQASTSLGNTLGQLRASRDEEAARLETARLQWEQNKISWQQYRGLRDLYEETEGIFKAHERLHIEINKAGRTSLVIAGAALEAGATALLNAHEMNQALQEANSSFFVRQDLMLAIAKAQQASGVQFATAVGAARALVRYGLESKSTFSDNIKTVSMLHEALGLSTDEAAHLAAVAENYARVSFQRVADVVATIVDQTALAAGEVKNLGTELTRTLGLIQPGPQTTLPQVIQALSGYEGALKQVTGHIGSFQKFIAHLATPEGMMAAGALGVNAEMIRTEHGIDQIMERFERMTQNIVGQTTGIERSIKLGVVGQIMNLTANEVNEMIRAMEIRRGQMITELTLQERYNRDAANLDQGISRLLSTLTSLLQQGLYPWVKLLSLGVNALASLIQKLGQWQYAGVTAMAAVAAGGVFLAAQLSGVAKAFWGVIIATKLAAAELNKYTAQQIASNIAGRFGMSVPVPAPGAGGISGSIKSLGAYLLGIGVGILGAFKATFSGIFNVLRAVFTGGSILTALRALLAATTVISVGVTAAVGALAYLGVESYKTWLEGKRAREDMANTNRRVAERSLTLADAARQKAYTAARYGDMETATSQWRLFLERKAGMLRADANLTPEQRAAQFEEVAKLMREDLGRARFTATLFDNSFVAGKFDKKAYDADIAKSVAEQLIILKQTLRNDQEVLKQQKITEEDNKEREMRSTLWYERANDPTRSGRGISLSGQGLF